VQHVARVLVTPSQATSLLTAGAAGLRAVKEGSGGAYVKVLLPEDSPFCALDGDRVTQISGGPVQVGRLGCLGRTWGFTWWFVGNTTPCLYFTLAGSLVFNTAGTAGTAELVFV
jgi:hypothetical protein